MCGIIGILGKTDVQDRIVDGLSRLEYRGYDSAGVAIMSDAKASVSKAVGKLENLKTELVHEPLVGRVGIGHTRWATHGAANTVNAHPHRAEHVTVVHNGIIENHAELKLELIAQGVVFVSETDTEVIAQLMNMALRTASTLDEAFSCMLSNLVGSFAIAMIVDGYEDVMLVARNGSPLAIGYGDPDAAGMSEMFVGSDALALAPFTENVSYLEDGDWAVITPERVVVRDHAGSEVAREIQHVPVETFSVDKGPYKHFMLKEIHEQPHSIEDCFRGRLNAKEGWVSLGGIKYYENDIINANRIVMVACGTSWHACLVGEYLFEDLARINVEVEYASEFRYRNPIINENDVVIAVSQSGETADTLAALELAKSKGATILGVCNVVGSSISRITHAGSYTHAGPEIGVASTKAFTAQVTVLTLMALSLAKKKETISESKFRTMLSELEAIPSRVQRVLDQNSNIEYISEQYKNASNALYLGRGSSFPVALEGALKLKEISYIHAEGYPAAEMKHGPIALIDEEMPVFVIATKGTSYEKVVSNIQEVKARKGKIIAIVTEGDEQVKTIADHTIEIPVTDEHLVPLLATVPLQLLSYHIAVMRECNVDQPRNLAKSVTVE